MHPFVDNQRPSIFSHTFNKLQGYCPCCCCCCASLERPQGLPEFVSQVPPQHLTAVYSYTPKQSATTKKGRSILLCDAIIQRPASGVPVAEVPVLTSEKHNLPKADFSSSSTAELPFPPVKALEPLFTSPFEEPFLCGDMAPRGCSHTAHTPVCMLFQPMKVPEVPPLKEKVIWPA